MRPDRPTRGLALSLAFVSLLVVGLGAPMVTLGAPGVAAGATTDAGAPATTADLSDPESVAAAQQQFDRTAFLITVYENGSARWTFRFERTLSNETERQDFQTFADRFNTEETSLYTDFVNRSEQLTASGTNATGRTMTATDFQRDARVGQLGNEGIVEMSFRWEGFAPVNDGRVVVGDVFEGGLYIRDDQRLVFTHGPGIVFEEVSPSPDSISDDSLAASDSVTWRGERTFTDERPRVVLAAPSAGTSTPATQTQSPTDGGNGGGPTATTPGGGGGGLGMLPLLALLAVLLLGVGAAIAYRSGALGGEGAAGATSEDGDGPDDGGAGAAAAGAGATAAGTDDDSDPEPAVTDAELLSDEERVMRLLDENGGRMKQVNIVDETDWSKSKVSMLLSEMEEQGEISKLRVGRENIISKKGMEPDAARSPFEDEDGPN